MRFKLLVLGSFLAILITSVADARPFRPGMIPNGFPAAGGCLACHTGFPRPGNSPSNVFDLEVEARVAPDGEEAFWNAELAALDSDGDRFTNGEELGDPDGVLEPGTASVGHFALVSSRPGSAESVPPLPKSVAVLNIEVDPAEEDPDVGFSRSISGYVLDFEFTGSTNSEGAASVALRAPAGLQVYEAWCQRLLFSTIVECGWRHPGSVVKHTHPGRPHYRHHSES